MRGGTPLHDVATAIHAHGFPGHEVRVDERDHHLHDLLIASPSPERRRLLDLFGPYRVEVRRRADRTGATAFTRMLSPASSSARASVRATIADFAT